MTKKRGVQRSWEFTHDNPEILGSSPRMTEEEKKVSEHDRRKKRLGHGGRGNRADRGFVRGCKRN